MVIFAAMDLVNGVQDKSHYFSGLSNAPKKKRTIKQEEWTLQMQCVKEFNRLYPHAWRLLYMVKNDGEKRQMINSKGKKFSLSGQRDKMAGLVPGVADLHLSIPNFIYHSLYIECKTEKGKQSVDQKEFQASVEHFNHKYIVVRSLSNFIEQINQYLKDVTTTKIPQGRASQGEEDLSFG